ncbi:MAG: hypothetical protein Q4G50_11800 [Corynebacterium sp.]|uniref:hypothetical protein n=1 Tax=Corynebacterium sp. TaxID=1720 RepID=UPI0026E106F1|nr:hypothetical protein [Corynebacterium sp.]MDO5670668.1 hypothetical protein [Corynebacterium sp.]
MVPLPRALAPSLGIADYSRWDHIRPFIPGSLGFLSGSVLGDLPTPPIVWPFYFAFATGVILWTFRSEGPARAGSDLAGGRHAPDGIRARMWRLAGHLDREVAEVREKVLALQKVKVVSVSPIDAGPDTSRHLVEITPVGVRVLTELRNR